MSFIDDVILGEGKYKSSFLRNLTDARGSEIVARRDNTLVYSKPNDSPQAIFTASVLNDILGYVPKQVANKTDATSFRAFVDADSDNINRVLDAANVTAGTPSGTALAALLQDPTTKNTRTTQLLMEAVSANNSFQIPIGGPGKVGGVASVTSPLQGILGIL